MSVSPQLLRHQWHNISAFAIGAVHAYNPFRDRGLRPWQESLPAPTNDLINAFSDWVGARPGRYDREVPVALAVSQVALAGIARLTMQAPYAMPSVLNQGVRLEIHQPLPRGEAVHLIGELLDASDDGYRARIHSRLVLGTRSAPQALTIESIAAVILRQRATDKTPVARQTTNWQTIGQWQASATAGREFFYLTGDFNPIHTLPVVARRTRFRGCIMHGYGAMSQLIECLQNQLDTQGAQLHSLDLRFIRPVPLPSPLLNIQIARDDQGQHQLRLADAAGTVYQVARYDVRADNRRRAAT